MAGPRSRTKTQALHQSSTDEKIGRIEATVDYLKEDFALMRHELKTMNETLSVNTKQLEVHIEGVKLAREQNDLLKKELETRVKPLEERHIQIKAIAWAAVKFGAFIVAIPALIVGAMKLIEIAQSILVK